MVAIAVILTILLFLSIDLLVGQIRAYRIKMALATDIGINLDPKLGICCADGGEPYTEPDGQKEQ